MKRSWFILVCAFLAINGFGVWKALQLWQAHLNRDETPPRLVASPDPATILSGRMPVQWIWDQPVVSPHQVGGEVIVPPAHFEPELAGRF